MGLYNGLNENCYNVKQESAIGKLLFTFGIIADGHVNPKEDRSSSPWNSNRLANARNRYVVNALNSLEPEFVIHLGDIIHPVPSSPDYLTAIEKFKTIFNKLICPLYLLPGNHDVGDKPSSWVPAESINENYLKRYRQYIGKDYFSFRHKKCNFILVNSELFNSGMLDEGEQSSWFINKLNIQKKTRSFVFLHYPPYINQPNEVEHYDNLREPARSKFLKIINEFNIEGLFCGHVHNFFYNRFKNIDCYVLPSVTFMRHDYSEMFRVGPEKEFGRNDRGKLGFFIVKVYENGHAVHCIRTYGKILTVNQTYFKDENSIKALNSRETWWNGLGVDLRQSWAEITDLPYSGGVDEFVRKKVRNDYPLMALWEMGVKRLRIPWHDLVDENIRQRIQDLKNFGHNFTIFIYDIPSDEQYKVLIKNKKLIESLEVILPWHEALSKISIISDLRSSLNLPVYLSKLKSSAEYKNGASKFQHFIKHGFSLSDQKTIETFLLQNNVVTLATGLVFRIGRMEDPWSTFIELNHFTKRLNLPSQFHVLMANENPAVNENDDLANANRIAETLILSLIFPETAIFLDTFADMDRGYFPRSGLVDRRYNLRLSSHVYRNLNSLIGPISHLISPETSEKLETYRICSFMSGGGKWVLLLPFKRSKLTEINLPSENISAKGKAVLFNLLSGNYSRFNWTKKTKRIYFDKKEADNYMISNPILLYFDAKNNLLKKAKNE